MGREAISVYGQPVHGDEALWATIGMMDLNERLTARSRLYRYL